MKIGDKVEIWEQDFKQKIQAEVVGIREGTQTMVLLKTPYGESWRSIEAVLDNRVLP